MAQSALSHVVKSEPRSDHRIIISTSNSLGEEFVAKMLSTWGLRMLGRSLYYCRITDA